MINIPRLVFESIAELKNWITEFIVPRIERYTLFHTTENKELIVHPIVTSRPILVGYISEVPNTKEVAEEIGKSTGLRVVKVKRLEWDTEKKPGVETTSGY